jgi:hypothetical protein
MMRLEALWRRLEIAISALVALALVAGTVLVLAAPAVQACQYAYELRAVAPDPPAEVNTVSLADLGIQPGVAGIANWFPRDVLTSTRVQLRDGAMVATPEISNPQAPGEGAAIKVFVGNDASKLRPLLSPSARVDEDTPVAPPAGAPDFTSPCTPTNPYQSGVATYSDSQCSTRTCAYAYLYHDYDTNSWSHGHDSRSVSGAPYEEYDRWCMNVKSVQDGCPGYYNSATDTYIPSGNCYCLHDETASITEPAS